MLGPLIRQVELGRSYVPTTPRHQFAKLVRESPKSVAIAVLVALATRKDLNPAVKRTARWTAVRASPSIKDVPALVDQ